MRTVILDAWGSENPIGDVLQRVIEERGDTVSYYMLKDMNILPCRSCGACGTKSPGRCVIEDDMHDIMRAIAHGDRIAMITPIRYGGYSAQLKKAVDKFMPLGMPLYIVKNGHLLHPMRYGSKELFVIGVADQSIQGQEENFSVLVQKNAFNMQSSYRTLLCKSSEDLVVIEEKIQRSLGEVPQYA